MRLGQPLQQRIALLGKLAQIGGDELVLGTEMAVERHLVGGGCLGDRLDADGADAVAIEKLARSRENALARRGLRSLQEWCVKRLWSWPLDWGVTGQYTI